MNKKIDAAALLVREAVYISFVAMRKAEYEYDCDKEVLHLLSASDILVEEAVALVGLPKASAHVLNLRIGTRAEYFREFGYTDTSDLEDYFVYLFKRYAGLFGWMRIA